MHWTLLKGYFELTKYSSRSQIQLISSTPYSLFEFWLSIWELVMLDLIDSNALFFTDAKGLSNNRRKVLWMYFICSLNSNVSKYFWYEYKASLLDIKFIIFSCICSLFKTIAINDDASSPRDSLFGVLFIMANNM